MSDTTIEWTNKTWNPVTGCTKVSPGCDHCYAEGIARRFAGGKAFPEGFAVTLHPGRLNTPKSWRTPSLVFVNSMSDLFHADIPDEFVLAVFQTMADTPAHTYQILTKRHGRMRSFCNRLAFREPTADETAAGHIRIAYLADRAPARCAPLPNVWLGVSVEDQDRAELRIPALLGTNAAVRFISAEPLIGPVDLRQAVWAMGDQRGHGLTASYVHTGPNGCCRKFHGLDWVIVGGESGNGARPIELWWVEQLIEQCAAAGTAVFVKQLGSAWARGHGYCTSPKGGEMRHWPEPLRVRQMPHAAEAETLPSPVTH